eukprot:270891-Pleurochrysis_carterae.AAC.1
MVEVVFDNGEAPWETMPMAKFTALAKPLVNTTSSTLQDGVWDEVHELLLASLATRGVRCPAVTLRDKYVPDGGSARGSVWEVYFKYTPGAAGTDFATDVTASFEMQSGMLITCDPPLVSSATTGANIALMMLNSKGQLLAVVFGSAYIATRAGTKTRRYVLASILTQRPSATSTATFPSIRWGQLRRSRSIAAPTNLNGRDAGASIRATRQLALGFHQLFTARSCRQ